MLLLQNIITNHTVLRTTKANMKMTYRHFISQIQFIRNLGLSLGFCFIIFCIIGCHHTDGYKQAINQDKIEEKKPYYAQLDVKKWYQEYLDFDSVLINGKIPAYTSKKSLLSAFGKPDQVRPVPNYLKTNSMLDYENTASFREYLVYGSTIFESNGKMVVLKELDLRDSSMSLYSSKINLTNSVRPIDIQEAFPESGRLITKGTSSSAGYILLKTAKNNADAQFWCLVFGANGIKKIILFYVPVYE
jgi:hypothetical protein